MDLYCKLDYHVISDVYDKLTVAFTIDNKICLIVAGDTYDMLHMMDKFIN